MSTVSTLTTEESEPRARSRRRVVVVGLLVAVLVVVVGVLGWRWWGAEAADGVSASTTFECQGTTTFTDREHDTVIRSRAGWTCTAHVEVINSSGHDVRVVAADSYGLGEGGGAEIKALDARTLPDERGDTARWALDEAVPAGGRTVVDLRIGWREEGCNADVTISQPRWPTLRVESLGRTVEVPSTTPLKLRTYLDPHDSVCTG